MTLFIRPFITSDLAMLIETINVVCGEGCWMSTLRFQPTPAWIHGLEEPACSHHLLLVLEDIGEVVGWCRIFPENCEGAEPVATLGVGLLAAYRNQGFGTSLVEASLNWAVTSELQRITLMAYPNNVRAVHVFAKCGFSFTGKTRRNSAEMACDLRVASDPNQVTVSSICNI